MFEKVKWWLRLRKKLIFKYVSKLTFQVLVLLQYYDECLYDLESIAKMCINKFKPLEFFIYLFGSKIVLLF